jgi:hypothetical protein
MTGLLLVFLFVLPVKKGSSHYLKILDSRLRYTEQWKGVKTAQPTRSDLVQRLLQVGEEVIHVFESQC